MPLDRIPHGPLLRIPILAALAWVMLAATPVAAQRQGTDCGECDCPGDRPPNPSDVPKIDVQIERIDTARYPDVDLYFRVVDANPTTEFHPLERADVKLEEGPSGGALAPATIVEDNFRQPDLRALATAVVLDRSLSVETVLPYIRQAIVSFIDLMEPANRNTYRADASSVGRADTTMTSGLSGNATLDTTKIKPYTTNVADLRSWVNRELVDTANGSPIFSATENAVIATARKSDYDLPDGSRLVFVISDGVNNRSYPNESQIPAPYKKRPDQAISMALANRVRLYTMGMVFVNNRGVAPGNICRNWMRKMADLTGGTYFEPINPFPVLPPGPNPPETADLNSPADLPDETARTYLTSTLATTANLAKSQGLDTRDLPLPANVKAVLAIAMAPLPDPYGYRELVRDWTPATLPTLTGLDQLTYTQLNNVQANVADLAAADVTRDELREKDYYNDQVTKVLTKVQASEKRIYRVRYRTDGAPFDGSPRDVKLTVQYRSSVNNVATMLTPGSQTINYKAPSVLSEDRATPSDYRIVDNPATRIVFGPEDPRGRPWTQAPRFRFAIKLMTEVQNPVAGQPPVQFPVATLDANGYQRVDVPGELANSTWVTQHVAAEQGDYEALLRSLEPEASLSGGTLTITLKPKTPTAIANIDAPTARPVPNAAEPARKRLQWYEITTNVERSYTYATATPPSTTLVNQTGTARVSLPTFSYYVADVTAPSLGIYLTPSGGSTSMVAVRQSSVDKETSTTEAVVLGAALGVPGEVRTLTAGFNGPPPYALKNGGSTPGFAVPQNIQVRIQVVAKDNYDRNHDHAYTIPPVDDKVVPGSDFFDLETIASPEAKDSAPPYMPKVAFDTVGQRSGENFVSGVSWRLEEAGQPGDNLTETKIFRAANVSVIDDTFQVSSGQEIFLTVKASDAAGRQNFVRVPILVTPVGLNIGKLTYETRRGR